MKQGAISCIVKIMWAGFALCALISALLVTGLISSIAFHHMKGGDLQSHYSHKEFYREPYIAGLKIYGEIDLSAAKFIVRTLDSLAEDKNALGVFLDVNSPGGHPVPGQMIYDAVLALRDKKPVVAYVNDVAASGAYYAIAPSSLIFANRGSTIGSIGVISIIPNYEDLLKFVKINNEVLKTGRYKDTGSPFRKMTTEDKKYIQDMIEKIGQQFFHDIKQVRPLSAKSLDALRDARVVMGVEAKSMKLVDFLGTEKKAYEAILKRAGKEGQQIPLHFIEFSEHNKLYFPLEIKNWLQEILVSSMRELFRA